MKSKLPTIQEVANLQKKNIGGIASLEGSDYETDFCTKQIINMLLGLGPVEVKRQKWSENVDDVYVKYDNNDEYHHQCRLNEANPRLGEYVEHFKKKPAAFCVLVTQLPNPDLSRLISNAKKFTLTDFVKRLKSRKKLNKKWLEVKSFFDNTPEPDRAAHGFLKKFLLKGFYYDQAGEEMQDLLISYGYSKEVASQIYSIIRSKVSKGNSLDVPITLSVITKDLEMNGIDFQDPIKRTLAKIVVPNKLRVSKNGHILSRADVSFIEKISFIIDFIDGLNKPRSVERLEVLDIIKDNESLAWHFFRNVTSRKKIVWIENIQEFLHVLIKKKGSIPLKIQILEFLSSCSEAYPDIVTELTLELAASTNDYRILQKLIPLIETLRPTTKSLEGKLWVTLRALSTHPHPFVRDKIPNTALKLSQGNYGRLFSILEKVLFYKISDPKDVVQGSPTLSLKFQGRDLENHVFEEVMVVFSQLLNDPLSIEKTLDMAMRISIRLIANEEKNYGREYGIWRDYSYIWLDELTGKRLRYHYDKKDRLPLEIQSALEELHKKDPALTVVLLDKMLASKREVLILVALRMLSPHIKDYMTVAKKVIFDERLWRITGIRDDYLQNIITGYFVNGGLELEKFTKGVTDLRFRNQKLTLMVQQNLFAAVPKASRTRSINTLIAKAEKELKRPTKVERAVRTESWSGPRPDMELSVLGKLSEEQLIEVMVESTKNGRAAPYDLSGLFSVLIKNDPDKLHKLLSVRGKKKIAPDFFGHMVGSFIESNGDDLDSIKSILSKLGADDTWARIDIARHLKNLCRNESIKTIAPSSLQIIKDMLLILSDDVNPERDGVTKSDKFRPEDAINHGINSVRGIISEAVVFLTHYYPHDRVLKELIRKLAADKTKTVKATLLYNLKFLLNDNYLLSKEVISKIKKGTEPELDYAVLHYFSMLSPGRFLGNLSLFKLLFKDKNDSVQKGLGDIVSAKLIQQPASKILHKLVADFVSGSKGTEETQRAIAFIFESRLSGIIESGKLKHILPHYLKLLSSKSYEVRERAAFALIRNEITSKYFEKLDKSGILDVIASQKLNISAHSHLVEYLEECLKDKKPIESRVVELLHKMATTDSDLFYSDQLVIQKIARVVGLLQQGKDGLDSTHLSMLEEVTDKGLQRGWDDFYVLFEQHYAKKGDQPAKL